MDYMSLLDRGNKMTRDHFFNRRANGRSGSIFLVLLSVLVMVSAPFFALGNEDLELIERSTGPGTSGTLGWNVTTVMDINNDGDTDYAIGAPGENMVYVFYGPMPASYSLSSANWRISGPSSSDFGWSVAGVEDYDSDGFDDLIIGAPAISRAYVFNGRSGSPGSISYTSSAITLEGTSGDLFGHSVASINYDNTSNNDYDAFIYGVVGAPQDIHFIQQQGADFQTGAVFLFNLTNLDSRGVSSANTTGANITFQGSHNNGWFGFAVENLGNVDGDPNDLQDLAISDPYFNKTGEIDNGAVYIQLGKNIFLEQRIILSSAMNGYIFGNANSRFGWSLKALGDISPTPEADFAVGAPWEDRSNPSVQNVGCAHVFYGQTGSFQIELGIATTADIELWGVNTGDRMGWSAARADIVDQNTRTIAIGAPGYDNGTSADAGAVFVFWQWAISQNYTSAKTKYYGVSAGDNLGYSMEGVYYRANAPDDIRLMTSSPKFGASNSGSIDLHKRNFIPDLSNLFVTPATGNIWTDFEIKVQYKDLDGNPPEYIRVYIYQDAQGTQVVDTVTLENPVGSSFEGGKNYTKTLKLPSSINSEDPNKPLYFRAEARAVRGSRDIVTFPNLATQNPRPGPVVDGVAPSAANDIFENSQGLDEDEEGIFKIEWKWPEENVGFNDPENTGKVKKLSLAIREGRDNLITTANWNDLGNLSDGKTTLYMDFTNNKVEKPFTRTSSFYIGRGQDPDMNPNSVQLKPRTYYNIAFRAMDEQNNWGPVSENLAVESWWRRPDIPQIDTIALSDYTADDDNGHILNVTWIPVNMLFPDDLSYYWIFINDEPFETLEELGKTEPDYNVSRADEYESFLDRYKLVEYYYKDGVETQLATGSSYYVSVVPFNWLDQRSNNIVVEGPVKVIKDEPPIDLVENVQAEDMQTGDQIRLTWDRVNDPKFVEYRIYGQRYYFDDIQDAFFITSVTDQSTTELIIDEVGDNPVDQATEFFFTVLVYDYNNNIDTTVDENNSAKVKTTNIQNPTIMEQVKGVSLKDRGADDGGVLQVTWFNLISKGAFWQYNVYFSDEEIASLTGLQPIASLLNYRTGSYEITDLDGEPLIDGKMYYAAVTMVSWDLVENTNLTNNNYDSAEPINQSDKTPPQMTVANARFVDTSVTETSFDITWDPVTQEEVQDFHHYLVKWRGTKSGQIEIEDRFATTFTIDGLERGEEYWFNITIIDDNGNIGPAIESVRVITAGVNTEPTIDIITISAGSDVYNRTNENSDEVIVLKEEVIKGQDIYFVGSAEDDYTTISNMEFLWNISTPDGKYIDRYGYTFPLDTQLTGTYVIILTVEDDEGGISDPLRITVEIKPEEEEAGIPAWVWILTFIAVVIIAVAVVAFVLISGKRSQKKQMLEQYEDRRKDIETMEPIYTDLPTWTCDCGTTQAKIIENAYCNSCYQSHEAVPIKGIDEYLKDHELVLTEMRIAIPFAWDGQEKAIENAKKDLEDRKERALKALNSEFAQWLKGTEYESEIPDEEDDEEGGPGSGAVLAPSGAIIPGQMPPPSPTQPTPMTPQPMPIQPTGQVAPTQASPMQPRPMGAPGQPQPIRPGMPQQPQQ